MVSRLVDKSRLENLENFLKEQGLSQELIQKITSGESVSLFNHISLDSIIRPELIDTYQEADWDLPEDARPPHAVYVDRADDVLDQVVEAMWDAYSDACWD